MSIKRKFAYGSAWLFGGNLFNQLASFAILVVLARLLTPTQFGVVAFALVFIDLSAVIVRAGTSDALVQRQEYDEDFASTAFWVNLAIACVFGLFCSAVVGPILGTSGYPGIEPVLAALSVTLVIDAVGVAMTAHLRRHFAFRQISSREIAANVLGGILGIAAAALGWGVWALVVQRLVASSTRCVTSWYLVSWRPRPIIRRKYVRELWAFSLHMTGAQLMSTLNVNLIPLILGFTSGPAALAIFRTGARGLRLVTSIAIAPIQQAALSAFSRVNPKSVANSYLRTTQMTALLACPAFIGAAAIAQDFVRVSFGPQWTESGPVMALLALMVGASAVNYFLPSALTAVGQTKRVFHFTTLTVVGNAVFTVISLPFGLAAIAGSQTARAYVGAIFALRFLEKGVGVRAMDVVRGVGLPLAGSAVMGIVLVLARTLLFADMSPALRIMISIPLGAFVYGLFMLLVARKFVNQQLAELQPLLPAALRRIFNKFTKLEPKE